jgi:dCMP deaminase
MTPKEWMELAKKHAEHSDDPKTKVGAVIVFDDSTWMGGYNRSLVAEQDWENRAEVRESVLHAEMAALLYRGKKQPSTLYTTLLPCLNCLKHAKTVGVSEVVFLKSSDNLKLISEWSTLFNIKLTELIE